MAMTCGKLFTACLIGLIAALFLVGGFFHAVEAEGVGFSRAYYEVEDAVPCSGCQGFAGPAGVSGTLTVAVIPVQFTDVAASSSISSIMSKASSMAGYWSEVSYGQLTLEVYTPFTAWLTMPNTMSYYGADSGSTIDVNYQKLVQDALNAADSSIDYRKVSYVIIVHAGNDQASSHVSTDIWSKASLGKWWFSNDGGCYIAWSLVAETDPYGAFCHEFGHNINLPDLYNSNPPPVYVGKWSLMDAGAWLSPPSSIMSVEKNWLGWIGSNTVTLSGNQIVNITLSRLTLSSGTLMVKVPAGSTYYAIEYRRRTGTDSALPMDGVIVAYVNEGLSSGKVRVQDANPWTSSLDDAAYTVGGRFVDASNAVAVKVLEEGSDSAKIMVQKGFADLQAVKVEACGVLEEDESIYFNVTVSNNGVVPSNYCTIEVYVDGVKVGETGLSSVPVGGSVTVKVGPWKAVRGNHVVSAAVDPTDNVVESNEGNNQASASFYIKEAVKVVVDRTWVSRARTDANRTEYVGFHVKWNNGSSISSGTLYVNGTGYPVNGTGWTTFPASYSRVGKLAWYVTGADVGGITLFRQDAPDPYIVWDMVSITLSPVGRSSVGFQANIKAEAYYMFDRTPFQGTLKYNDSLVKYAVGAYSYKVTEIVDAAYGLKLFSSNTVTVVFDKIKFTLSPASARVDVNGTAAINVSGKHLYDGRTFNGRVEFSNNLTQSRVGNFSYTVSKAVDYDYNVVAFESNTVYIVFDQIVLAESGASGARCGVGTSQLVWFKLAYAFDGKLLNSSNARVYVEGQPAEYDSGAGRWRLQVTEYTVSRKVYKMTGFQETVYGLKSLSCRAPAEQPIVWDKIVVTEFKPVREHVDVGSEAEFTFKGYYAYDGSVWRGSCGLNDSLVKYSVGKVWYSIVSVSDPLFSIQSVEVKASPAYVVFDKVVFKVSSGKSRIDVGSTAQVNVEAWYAYDLSPFNGTFTLSASLTRNTVGANVYTVASMVDRRFGLKAFESNNVTVVFDKIVFKLTPARERFDVGSKAEIRVDGAYAFDQTPFYGVYEFNGSLVQDRVGRYLYRIARVNDSMYGLTAFESDTVPVVFDKVVISLSVEKERFNVGEEAEIRARGFYAFDSLSFDGVIEYNCTLTQNSVGRYTCTVSRIVDRLYGLKTFESNSVTVVFDRIVFTVEAECSRVRVGTPAKLKVSGVYEFDGQKLDGTWTLNHDIISYDVGTVYYSVAKVFDRKFGLTAFKSNSVPVTFDRIVCTVEPATVSPGSIEYTVWVKYESDGVPVEDAVVKVNGMTASPAGNGKHVLKTQALGFSQNYSVEVSSSLMDYSVQGSTLHVGNIAATAAIATAATVAAAIAFKKIGRRKQ